MQLVHFKAKKLKIKGFKNIYQELMKEVEKKEDIIVFLWDYLGFIGQ